MRALAAKTDWVLVGSALLLSGIGIAMIYSCCNTRHESLYLLQLAWLGIGLIVAVALCAFDYIRLQPLAPTLYGIVLALLALVLFAGTQIRGAQRWLPLGPFHLQPAEFAKVAVVLAAAAFIAGRSEEGMTARVTVASFALMLPAMVLVLLQPDLGTPVVMVGAWLILAFVAGARLAHLAAVVSILGLCFLGAWKADIIKPHQKARLLAFANPEAERHGAAWQVRQGLVAIGAGHLLGQGFMRGTQTQLAFIPDQHSDFIFTAIGEELGFVGAVTVLGLLALFVHRGFAIAASARELFGRLLAAGLLGIIATHTVINVGMTLGLMPVKGMPLPFVSYGGSHMLACMMIVGLLNNIHVRQRRIDFDL
ncbi:MAG: rod shape-determining protein RodA [Armatimonadetes bacterium]|nr:rod shape-determining protein RodA [Armatimonadota bacterium]